MGWHLPIQCMLAAAPMYKRAFLSIVHMPGVLLANQHLWHARLECSCDKQIPRTFRGGWLVYGTKTHRARSLRRMQLWIAHAAV